MAEAIGNESFSSYTTSGNELLKSLVDRECWGATSSTLDLYAEDAFIRKMRYNDLMCDLPGQPRSTFLMVFSPDGTKVASTHGNHNIYVSDVKTGRNIKTLVGHPRTPWCIAFHPTSNQVIASGCLGGQVRIWDFVNGSSEVWTSYSRSVIASIAFHPNDRVLIIATYNELYFWDWSSPEPFAHIATGNPKEKIRYVAFDRLGQKLITGIANSGPAVNNSRIFNIPVSQFGSNSPGRQIQRSDTRLSVCYRNLLREYQYLMQRYLQVYRYPVTVERGTDPMSDDENTNDTNGNDSTTNPQPSTSTIIKRFKMTRSERPQKEASTQTLSPRRILNLGTSEASTSTAGCSTENDQQQQQQQESSSEHRSAFTPAQPLSTMYTSIVNDLESSLQNIRNIRINAGSRPGDLETTTVVTIFSRTLESIMHQSDSIVRNLGNCINSLPDRRCRPIFDEATFQLRCSDPGVDLLSLTRSCMSFRADPEERASEHNYSVLAAGNNNNNGEGNDSLSRTRRLMTQIQRQASLLRQQVESIEYIDRVQFEVEQLQIIRQLLINATNSIQNLEESQPSTSNKTTRSRKTYPPSRLNHSQRFQFGNSAPYVIRIPPTPRRPIPSRPSTNFFGQLNTIDETFLTAMAQRLEYLILEHCHTVSSNNSAPSDTETPTMNRCANREQNERHLGVRLHNCISRLNRLTADVAIVATMNQQHATQNERYTGRYMLVVLVETIIRYIERNTHGLTPNIEYNGQIYSLINVALLLTDLMILHLVQSVPHRNEFDNQRSIIGFRIGQLCNNIQMNENEIISREFISILNQIRIAVLHDNWTNISVAIEPLLQQASMRSNDLLDGDYFGNVFRVRDANDETNTITSTVNTSSPTTSSASSSVPSNPNIPIPTVQINNIPVNSDDVESAANYQHLPTVLQRRLIRQLRFAERYLTYNHPRYLHPFYVNAHFEGYDWEENPSREVTYDCDRHALLSLNHRIQAWDMSTDTIPVISNPLKNIIVSECKIHNDASVDITTDGTLLVTLLPSGDYLKVTNRLGVYSLQWESLGQCLYTTSFEQNAVSVSLSPLNRYLIVGLATRRVSVCSNEQRPTLKIAKVFLLNPSVSPFASKLQFLKELDYNRPLRPTTFNSVNCIRWLPQSGRGLIFGTNSGELIILS